MISIVQGVGRWVVFLPGLGAHRLTISILGLNGKRLGCCVRAQLVSLSNVLLDNHC
jgi:hypothetical protein